MVVRHFAVKQVAPTNADLLLQSSPQQHDEIGNWKLEQKKARY